MSQAIHNLFLEIDKMMKPNSDDNTNLENNNDKINNFMKNTIKNIH